MYKVEFESQQKREGLKFDYNLYDAVLLDDGRKVLITGFGIYDNQYWCEVLYPDGIHLGAADYFSSDENFRCTHIVEAIPKHKKFIISELIRAYEEQENIFKDLDYSPKKETLLRVMKKCQ